MKYISCLTAAESDMTAQILGDKCCLLTQMKHAFHHGNKGLCFNRGLTSQPVSF